MKIIGIKVGALLLVSSMVLSSCIGSFALFNKYEEWQCSMTSNKYVNGIVGLILQPIVAPVCCVVDALVLNTIEFWTDQNPLAVNQQVMGADGRLYAVRSTKKGYKVTAPNGEVTQFIYNAKKNAWSVKKGDLSLELFQFNNDGTITVNLQNGETMTVGNNEAGMQQVQQAVAAQGFFAQR